MDFEKKYWSTNEFVNKQTNEEVNGYVGIRDGVAYDFSTGDKLEANESYIAKINCSNKHFDRALGKELKLPYAKSDITFAANDFLYSGIIKTAVERLQANTDYLFQNSIISNSQIPVTDECILLSSILETQGEGDNLKYISTGKLGKYNFSSSALSTKTQDDRAFYPDIEVETIYYTKNKLGKLITEFEKDILYVKGGKPDNTRYVPNTTDAKEIWKKLNSGANPFDGEEIEVEEFSYVKPSISDEEIETLDKISKTYNIIPDVERVVSFSYVWVEDIDNPTTERVALPNITYKFLTESEEWKKAVKPGLVNVSWSTDNTLKKTFIPSESMTAADVYGIMSGDLYGYTYPKLKRTVQYNNKGYVKSPYYVPVIYDVTNKSIAEVAEELKNETELAKYDKVPFITSESTTKTVYTDDFIHNFNEITCSDIVIYNVNETEKSVYLLVFLGFKTELVIFRTKYYYSNPSKDPGYTSNNYIRNNSDLSKDDLIINLNKEIRNGVLNPNCITIKNIIPNDTNSLEFLNLNAIKIYKNMLYVIDNKLDMVLRYDIDYLINSDEADKGLSTKFIELLDIMQGYGDSTDKIYFNNPYSIDVCDDYVYIVDRGNNCVKEYTPSLNYIKTMKNGHFASHDIQAVAINPYPCTINGISIKKNSLWIASVVGTRIYLSILEDDIVKVYGQIEDISLLQDQYSWLEEIRGIKFSECNSNYFYINTTKRVYKLHVSNPFYPFASLNYFKQRSFVNTMRWTAMRYPWHNTPTIYAGTESSSENVYNDIIWDYVPSRSSAEILDNKCFCLASIPQIEGDVIFHYGILYDDSKIRDYIKDNQSKFNNKMTFNDIELGHLSNMIKSSAMLIYSEPASFISSLNNNYVNIFDAYKLDDNIENDYINSLTFNKLIHALIYNLLKLKNVLTGHFKAATNYDNVIVYDNLVLDDYFNNLKLNAEDDYFVHNNEPVTIIVNRVLENIYDVQVKILNKIQTEFMAAQSYVNNTSRII